jgi:hypothetical protein
VLGWLRDRKVNQMKAAIKDALFEQALVCVRDGMRFQFRVENIGGLDQIKPFLTKLSSTLGFNVRANCGHGLVTLYSEDHDGTGIVVATIKNGTAP